MWLGYNGAKGVNDRKANKTTRGIKIHICKRFTCIFVKKKKIYKNKTKNNLIEKYTTFFFIVFVFLYIITDMKKKYISVLFLTKKRKKKKGKWTKSRAYKKSICHFLQACLKIWSNLWGQEKRKNENKNKEKRKTKMDNHRQNENGRIWRFM